MACENNLLISVFYLLRSSVSIGDTASRGSLARKASPPDFLCLSYVSKLSFPRDSYVTLTSSPRSFSSRVYLIALLTVSKDSVWISSGLPVASFVLSYFARPRLFIDIYYRPIVYRCPCLKTLFRRTTCRG